MNGIIIDKSFSKLHPNDVPNQFDIRQFLKNLLFTWALLYLLEYLIFIPLRDMVLDILRTLCFKTLDFEIEKKLFTVFAAVKMIWVETSLVIQWLRLYTPKAGGMGSIPSWRNKILHATQMAKKLKKKKNWVVILRTQFWLGW